MAPAHEVDMLDETPLHQRLAAAVADAAEEVRSRAHGVTRRRGGRGAVREELAEAILRAKGKWQAIVGGYVETDQSSTAG